MTNEEAIRRILDHKRVHSLNEPRAVLINEALDLAINALEERPQGYFDMSKLRLMTVEECAGHTIDYAMGWKACIEWIKNGGDMKEGRRNETDN